MLLIFFDCFTCFSCQVLHSEQLLYWSIFSREAEPIGCVCMCTYSMMYIYSYGEVSISADKGTSSIHCINTISFYIRDLSIQGFGIDGGFWNQSPMEP